MFKYSLLLILCLFVVQAVAQSADPTAPLLSSKQVNNDVVKKSLVLESIIKGKKIKSAIINGKLMKVGDYIGSHKLISVNRSSVILRSESGRIKLSIFSGVVVK